MISSDKPLISEPKVLVTGVEGTGKTLFAVQQADLLTREEGGILYTLNIRGADPGHLPKLPFGIADMAYNDDGTPQLDPETGDHLPKWATLPPGSVILIDEAHKVFPQRGPGRAPKHIEMLAEGRQFGIRFILLTQAPQSLDSFLRDRISRHYHLERKGNMERATVFEFDHCVMWPRTAWQERKDAQVHFWAYPKQYYGWYTSAKAHTFKRRIPFKIVLAALFVPLAIFIGWNVYTKVSSVMEGTIAGVSGASSSASSGSAPVAGSQPEGRHAVRATDDPAAYLRQFQPVVGTHPWSAPVYQGREVRSQPDLYCMRSSSGVGADGNWREGRCSCFTEQATRYGLDTAMCNAIVDAGGIYNPYRDPQPRDTGRGQAKPAEARFGPSGVPAPQPNSTYASGAGGLTYGQMAAYGDMGVPTGRYVGEGVSVRR